MNREQIEKDFPYVSFLIHNMLDKQLEAADLMKQSMEKDIEAFKFQLKATEELSIINNESIFLREKNINDIKNDIKSYEKLLNVCENKIQWIKDAKEKSTNNEASIFEALGTKG